MSVAHQPANEEKLEEKHDDDFDIVPFQPNARRQIESSAIVHRMLNPHGNLRLAWDFCMVVFLCYTMFSEPVFMGASLAIHSHMREFWARLACPRSASNQCLLLQALT